MTEQLSPIGIDSTLDQASDRIDALFTVSTGSIGFQQVNYHTIDEERKRYSLTLPAAPVVESLEQQRTSITSIIDDGLLDAKSGHKGSASSELNAADIDLRPARFSLPEINSANQHERSSSIPTGS